MRKICKLLWSASLLFLAGCNSIPYWQPTELVGWEWKDTKIHVVDSHPYADTVGGWAHRDIATGVCTVIISRRADYNCVLAHELKHCAGWDHPDHPVNLGCFQMPLFPVR